MFFQKFDIALLSMSVTLITLLYFLKEKRLNEFLITIIIYPIFILLIWISITGSFEFIDNYFFIAVG